MPAQVQLGWPGRGIPIGPKEGRFAGIESPARLAVPDDCGAPAPHPSGVSERALGRLRRDLRRVPVPPGELPRGCETHA